MNVARVTAEEGDPWLVKQDRHRNEILALFRETYIPEQAERWFQRWWVFFMVCAELFGYRRGEEWGVSHYRFGKQGRVLAPCGERRARWIRFRDATGPPRFGWSSSQAEDLEIGLEFAGFLTILRLIRNFGSSVTTAQCAGSVMLTIRPEQMEILAAASGRYFENRLLTELEILFPNETARLGEHADGREHLRRFVRQGFDRAAQFGIENEDDYAVFVALMLFNRRPDLQDERERAELLTWSRVLLERPTTPGHVKMALIEYRLHQMAPGNPKATQLCAIIDILRERF